MGICDSPKKKRPKRKRKTSYSTGKNAGHRHRGQPKMPTKPVDWFVDYAYGVTALSPGTHVEVGYKTDEMWDTHGFIQNWYNPCVREKFAGGGEIPPIVDEEGVIVAFNSTSPSPRNLIRSTVPFLSAAQLDELALRSEDRLTEVIPQNVSLANFIIELIQMCTGNVSKIKKFSEIYVEGIKRFRAALKRFRAQGHKETAAYWLAWNFAIKPMISDLRGILCSISEAYKRLKWLMDHNHKVFHLDYVRKDLDTMLSYDRNAYVGFQQLCAVTRASPGGAPPNGSYHLQARFVDVKLSYRARSKVFLEIPDHFLTGMYGIGALWSAMNGLYNPVGIIWEAIPFSWLIDYFLSYRARLFQARLDMNPFDSGITVLGYGHSFRLKAIGDTRIQNTTFDVTHSIQGGFEYQLYWRTAGLPFPEETTLFRLPNTWYQLSIIGAIVVGNFPARR